MVKIYIVAGSYKIIWSPFEYGFKRRKTKCFVRAAISGKAVIFPIVKMIIIHSCHDHKAKFVLQISTRIGFEFLCRTEHWLLLIHPVV